jgi:hypothetical protein
MPLLVAVKTAAIHLIRESDVLSSYSAISGMMGFFKCKGKFLKKFFLEEENQSVFLRSVKV